MLCREAVKENENSNVTFDMLVTKVTPRARALVPDTVKKELLQKIKTYLLTQKDQQVHFVNRNGLFITLSCFTQ